MLALIWFSVQSGATKVQSKGINLTRLETLKKKFGRYSDLDNISLQGECGAINAFLYHINFIFYFRKFYSTLL